MGLFRLIFLIAAITLVYWLWRRFARSNKARKQAKPVEAQPMVRCVQCGVHLPREHALAREQQWFCSREHLEQGSK